MGGLAPTCVCRGGLGGINQGLTIAGQTGGMRWFGLLILLGACGAQPSPTMMGAQRAAVEVAGRSYVVFWTPRRVEVIRLGWASPGEHQGIRATMLELIPQVTGCRLNERSVAGDSGVMRGAITCPRGP